MIQNLRGEIIKLAKKRLEKQKEITKPKMVKLEKDKNCENRENVMGTNEDIFDTERNAREGRRENRKRSGI